MTFEEILLPYKASCPLVAITAMPIAIRRASRSSNSTIDAISVRTVGRVMALNKQVYDDIPHVPNPPATKPPGLHPYKAT